MDPSIFFIYSVQPAYSLVFPAHRFFPADLSEISSLAFFHLLCYNPNRLTECSMRGSALVLRSIQLLDDEDQIAREPVFRAERISGKIDRPNPSVRGGFSASAGRRGGICSAAYAVFYARGREKEFIWRVCT